MKKLAFVLIAALMITCLSACGSSEGSAGGGAAEPEVHETTKMGNINVYVPDGYKAVQGSLIDENDQNAVQVQLEDDPYTYVVITADEEEYIDSGIETTKYVNSDCTFTDMNLTYDNGTFVGFSYESFGIQCACLKGTLPNGFVQVSSGGMDIEGEDYLAIIASISIAQ